MAWLRNLFVNNWELKLLAFVLAVLSFYAIRGATSDEATAEAPINVEIGEGIGILKQEPPTARVTFRGSRDDLRRLEHLQVRIALKAKASDPSGSETLRIRPRDVKGAIGLRVVGLAPQTVNLVFDHEEKMTIPVAKPKTIGTPLVGKAELDYEPRFVKIRGPKRKLEEMLKEKTAIDTERVNVQDRSESFFAKVKVLSPGETWISKIEPEEIDVKVSIITRTETRNMADVPVLTIAAPGDDAEITVDPPVVSVSLEGPSERLDALSSGAVKVFVDCVGLAAPATYELPVTVHMADGGEISAVTDPKTVKVILGKP